MFYFSVEHRQISKQVAGLINSYNNLSAARSVSDVQNGKIDYVVEVHGKWVLGAVGLDRQGYTFTEIKHLVVHPDWRGKGVAKHLLRRALNISGTKMVYATVREDNKASLKLFEGFKFQRAGSYSAEDHNVILLVRASPQWEQIRSDSKSHWLTAENLMSEITRSLPKSLTPGKKMAGSG